jgi:hypothetical protein
MVKAMAPNPLILALANPNPEILPEEVRAVRGDAIICTGRSDYPNQVNNVLCFPYIFRGALDCGATTITREMEIAVVHAIAELAHAEQSDIVATTYGITNLSFGPEYLIPMPFDPRLLIKIAPAVAKAAEDSGVATRPIKDLQAYADSLQQFVYRSGTFMKPLFQVAKKTPRRPETHRLRRRRRRARAARGAGHRRRKTGASDPGRPSGRAGNPHHQVRPAPEAGRGLRRHQPGPRRALSRLLARVLRADRAQGRDPGIRQAGNAPPPHPDRRHDDQEGRRRRHDLRHLRHHPAAPALHRPGAGQARGRLRLRRDERADPAGASTGDGRHPRQRKPERQRTGGHHRDGGRGNAPLRPVAARGAAVALELRFVQQ